MLVQSPADLEREVEIAPRGAPDPRNGLARGRDGQARAQQQVELVAGEAAQRHPLEVPARQRPVEAQRHVRARAAPHAEEPDPLVGEPPRHEAERALGGRVEPLGVIDRDERGSRLGQPAQQPEQAHADRELERLLPVRLGP